MIKIVILGKIGLILAILEKNEPLGSLTKTLQNLESCDTALFTILCYRGSSEPTEAFCL